MEKIMILTIFIFFSSSSYAFDFERVSFYNAIRSKDFVCIGFVESIYITKKGEGWIKAKAKVIVEKCLKGTYCNKGKPIYINYFTQNIHGTILPIDIEIGKQVILAVDDDKIIDDYQFDSDINDGIDYCYICDIFPISIVEYDHKFSCRDSMTKDRYNDLLWSKIESIFVDNSKSLSENNSKNCRN